MNKIVYLLYVVFPDPEAGEHAYFEKVVSSHKTVESAHDAAKPYGSSYRICEVTHYA